MTEKAFFFFRNKQILCDNKVCKILYKSLIARKDKERKKGFKKREAPTKGPPTKNQANYRSELFPETVNEIRFIYYCIIF